MIPQVSKWHLMRKRAKVSNSLLEFSSFKALAYSFPPFTFFSFICVERGGVDFAKPVLCSVPTTCCGALIPTTRHQNSGFADFLGFSESFWGVGGGRVYRNSINKKTSKRNRHTKLGVILGRVRGRRIRFGLQGKRMNGRILRRNGKWGK
jgi:hypothetical protein